MTTEKLSMPEDMAQVITTEQLALLNELYQREGEKAVLRYLVDHENTDMVVAKRWMKSLGFIDDTCKSCFAPTESIESFDHYCMFCNEVWTGADGSLCPLCGTDGLNADKKREGFLLSFIGRVRETVGV